MEEIKIFEFDPQIYPRKLWVVSSVNEKELKKVFVNTDRTELDLVGLSDFDAIVYSVRNIKDDGKIGELVILVRPEQVDTGKIVHESIHVALDIFFDLGMRVDYENQEPFTYLSGWVGKCIEKVIKDNKEDEKTD